MNEDSQAVTAAIAGAVIGGVVGFLFFTNRGRDLRRQFEPALDDLARELSNFRQTVRKAAVVAGEGWRMLNEAAESGSKSPRFPSTHQSSPF